MTNSERLAAIRKKREEENKKSSGRRAANGRTTTNTSANKTYKNSDRLNKIRLERKIGFDTFESDLKTIGTTVDDIYKGWQPKETMENTRSTVESMRERISAFQEYQKLIGGEDAVDISDLENSYNAVLEDWDLLAGAYGQYKTADAFNAVRKKTELDKKFRHKDGTGYTFEEVQEELKKYAPDSDEYKYLSTYTNYSDLNDFNKAIENYKSSGDQEAFGVLEKKDSFAIDLNSPLEKKDGFNFDIDLTLPREEVPDFSNAANETNAANKIQDNDYYEELQKKKNKHELANKFDLYKGYTEAKDFGEKSQYWDGHVWATDSLTSAKSAAPKDSVIAYDKESKTYYVYSDPLYEYVNNQNNARNNLTNGILKGDYKKLGLEYSNKGYDELEEIEIQTFNYIDSEEGREKALEYLEEMSPTLTRRKNNEKSQELEKTIDSNAWAGAGLYALSFPATLAGGMGNIFASVDEFIKGEELNPYHRYRELGNFASDTREYVGENIAEATDGMEFLGQNIPSFLQGTGTSIGDTALGVLTAGPAYLAIAASNAFQQKAKEMYEAGEDQDTILKAATTSAVAEFLFEKIGIDNLFKIKSVDSLKSIFKNALKQAGAEGLEEFGTELTNIIGDHVIRGKNSELYKDYKDLIARGYSEKEALTQTALKATGQVVWAGVGGALSGGVMGGGASYINYAENKAQGKTIRGNERVSDMLEIASMTPQESEAYEAYTEYAKREINAENITDAQLGNLRGLAEVDAIETLRSKDTLFKKGATEEQKISAVETLHKLNKVDTDNVAAKEAKELTKDLKTGENTEITETGKSATIKGIKIDTNEVITAEGETVSENDVTFSERDKELLGYAKRMDETSANLLLEVDDGKTDVTQYLNSFNLVMKLAEHDFTQDTILEKKGVLSNSQVNAIYSATVINTYKAEQAAIDNLNKKWGNAFTIQGKIDDSAIDYDNTGAEGKVAWNSLNTSQRKAITFMKGLARATGMNLRLISNGIEEGINGAYKISENTIILDIYAGMDKVEGTDFSDTIIPTASHEMTHWMKYKAKELYRAIDEIVFRTLKKSGLSEEDILEQRRKQMEKSHPGKKISPQDVRDEVIARACEDMLAMSEEGKKLFNSLSETEQKTFVEKIQEIIQNLKDWVSDLLSHYKATSWEAREMRKYQDSLEELSKLWDEMLKQAIQTNQSLQKEGITGEELAAKVTNKQGVSADEQFSSRKKKKKYWRPGFSYAEYNELVGIARYELGKPTGYIDNENKWLYNNRNGKTYFAIYSTIDVDNPTILYASNDKTAQDDNEWFKLFIAEKELLENGRNDLQRTTINEVLVSLGYALDQSGVHNVVNADQRRGGNRNAGVYSEEPGIRPSRALQNCLENLTKIQERESGVTQYSDRDTFGNTLTNEQQSYFAESKVRDENGNLKVMYHGTPNATFTKFRSGTYFTEHKWYADNYQSQGASSLGYKKTADNPDTYAVYLNIKKPFDTRNKKERDIFKNEYYRQWGTGTDLMESGLPDWLDGQDLQEFLEEQGYDYDGLILDEGGMGGYGDEVIGRGLSYVVFSPEQVKSVENKTPTNDSDYRFSMRENVEETKDLVAVHNLSEEKLMKSLKLGGLPMPSIAIIKARDGHNTFGSISLVFGKDTIDPQFIRKNKVYSGDAWTPTYPRVEYKVSYKAAERIRNKIDELLAGTDYKDAFGYLALDTDSIQDYLDRNNGDVYDAYGRKEAIKLAYLKDKGIEVELPSKENDLSYKFDNAVIVEFANKYDEEKLYEMNNYDNTSMVDKHIPEIKALVEKYYSEQVGKDMEWEIDRNDVWDFIGGALKYLQKGITKKTDTYASRDIINSAIDENEYKSWLDSLFSDIIEKEGIRNNTDLFTPSGNRRSFEALHYEHNLENVIKAMKESGEKGIGAFGGGNIFGAATTEYTSISEIKEAAQTRLKKLPDEEYEVIRNGFSDRLFELAYSLPIHKDSFTATDDAANMLIEAVTKFKTKSGIANYLRTESKGWANYSDYVVDDLVQLVSEIRQMPIGYFEAKPQRAVGFDEVATAIIPDSTSAELKTLLTNNGVKFVEYEKGNDEARLDALNSIEDVKFSDRDQSYLDAVDRGDMETAQRMVDEAAKRAGYSVKAYHGTYNFGRTVFNAYDNLYLTDSEYTAKNFSGGSGKRLVSDTEFDPETAPIERVVDYVANNTGWGDIEAATIELVDEEIKRWTYTKSEIKKYKLSQDDIEKYERWVKKLRDVRAEMENGTPYWTGINVSGLEIPNARLADDAWVRRIARESVARKGYHGGSYELLANLGKTVVVDGGGKYWYSLPVPKELHEYASSDNATTDQIVDMAYEAGYDSVTFKDIREGGDYGDAGVSTVYAVFKPTQRVKSADPVTYDDNGNVIPLSKRFDASNEDIRYSDRDNDSGFNINDFTIDDLLKMSDEKFQQMYDTLGIDDLFESDDLLESDDSSELYGGEDISIDDISEELNIEPKKIEILVRRSGLGASHIEENHTAVMTQERIDNAIWDSGAGFNPNYARKYITRISTKDFIDLTVIKNHIDREVFDSEVEGDHGSTMGDYDYDSALRNSKASPYLCIDKSTGRITGHNGRHRIRALEMAGIESVEILVEFYDEDGSLIKHNPETIPDMAISSQFDTAIETHISNIIPVNETHRAEIERNYGEKAHANAGVRYSDRYNDDDIRKELREALGELSKVRSENKKIKEDIERLRERLALERQVTGGNAFNRSQLDAVAAHIRNLANSDYSKKELVKLLDDVYTYIITAKELTWDDLYSKLYDISKTVLEESRLKKVDENGYFKQVLKEIRSKKISLSDVQKQELESAYGMSWNKAVFGRLNVSDDATMDLDSQWSEWANVYPGLFDAETTEGDQIIQLLEMYDDLKDGSEIYEDLNNEDMTRWLANEIYNQYWNVSTIKTTADKYAKQIKQLNWKHREAMKELRENHQDRLEKQKIADTMYYNGIIAKIRRSKNEEIQKVRKLGKERMDRYKENAKRKTLMQSILSTTTSLNKKFLTNSKDVHIPEVLKPVVRNLIAAIDFSSKRLLNKNEPTKRDMALEKTFSKVRSMADENISLKDAIWEASKMFTEGNNIFSTLEVSNDLSLAMLDLDLVEKIVGTEGNNGLLKSIDVLEKKYGDNGFVLENMSIDDLNILNAMVKSINHWANRVDKALAIKHKEGIANLGMQTIEEDDALGEYKERGETVEGIKKFFSWSNLLPVNAFERMGTAAKKVFESLQDAQDKLVFNQDEIEEFTAKLFKGKEKEIKKWREDVRTFNLDLPNGKKKTIRMPVSYMMSLYAVAKQEDAMRHLMGVDQNGNVLDQGGGMTIKGFKDKGGITKDRKNTLLTKELIAKITGELSEDQKYIANELQKFMNEKGSSWGDSVSMALYGIKKFGINNYFPITVTPTTIKKLNTDNKNTTHFFAILNFGFTKSRNPNAKQSIEIGDIFDVFTNHMTMMAIYNAYALPIYDMVRWYNYHTKTADGEEIGVIKSLQDAFGEGATSYVEKLITDLNGQHESSRLGFINRIFKNTKVAMVGNSLSVAALQPMAYPKAALIISPKYLTKSLFYIKDFGVKKGREKAKKYSGIALWKSKGNFDVDISRNMSTRIMHNETWRDKLIEWSLKGAEKGDEFTWGMLWNACEFEIRDTRKDLKVGSEEFYEAIANRLREIVYKTQVVDSPLTRSEIMRSPDGMAKSLTMFASELTVAYNIVSDAFVDAHLDVRKNGKKGAMKRNGGKIARAMTIYTVTSAVSQILTTAMQAFRDDDDEKEFEDYLKMYLTNFALDWAIIGKLPYIKEALNYAQGYSSSKVETVWMVSAFKAAKYWAKAFSGEGGAAKAIENSLKTISYLSGVAGYNQYRDLMATLDTLGMIEKEDFEEWLDEIFG